MNRIISLAICFAFAIAANGQETAEDFLTAVPQLAFNPCTATWEQKTEFKNDVGRIDSLLRATLETMQQDAEQFHENHQDEEMINVLMQQGYSREDAEKLKNADQMSDEEKMEIANKMMMDKYSMNTDDLKKVAKMDTAAQRRWVKAQSTISMAETEADTEKNENEQLKIKKNLDLQNELKFQNDKLRAGENKYLQKLNKLNKEADTARVELNKQLEQAEKDLENCRNDQQRDQIHARMKQLKEDFCNRFTPGYLEIVGQFKVYIGQNLKEYYKLEELQMKSVEAQTGVKNPDYKPGSVPMGIVDSYINLIADSFRYDMNFSSVAPIFD
jgi:hypothetical protein